MPQVRKRPQAEADLDDIWWCIAQENPDAADRLLDSIDDRCATLAQFPSIGPSRDALLPNLRSLPVGNDLIFSLSIPDGIEVVRVLPGMRDIDALAIGCDWRAGHRPPAGRADGGQRHALAGDVHRRHWRLGYCGTGAWSQRYVGDCGHGHAGGNAHHHRQ